ncbi:Inactive ubiquitin carboxyl-terminal hydrolase 54 [Fagus crenata]
MGMLQNRHFSLIVPSITTTGRSIKDGFDWAGLGSLLYEATNEGKEYEEVVQECKRSLAIENPIDPAKESLQEESQQKILTTEARIGHVQNELRQLIQKFNISSLSTWMKNLGSGEEKFGLIPIRRAVEDPMELRLVQSPQIDGFVGGCPKSDELPLNWIHKTGKKFSIYLNRSLLSVSASWGFDWAGLGSLLYEATNEGKEYEEVVQECKRSLAIENPIDPAKESLQEESQQKILTAEARIGHVQNELRQADSEVQHFFIVDLDEEFGEWGREVWVNSDKEGCRGPDGATIGAIPSD